MFSLISTLIDNISHLFLSTCLIVLTVVAAYVYAIHGLIGGVDMTNVVFINGLAMLGLIVNMFFGVSLMTVTIEAIRNDLIK